MHGFKSNYLKCKYSNRSQKYDFFAEMQKKMRIFPALLPQRIPRSSKLFGDPVAGRGSWGKNSLSVLDGVARSAEGVNKSYIVHRSFVHGTSYLVPSSINRREWLGKVAAKLQLFFKISKINELFVRIFWLYDAFFYPPSPASGISPKYAYPPLHGPDIVSAPSRRPRPEGVGGKSR